MKRLLAALVLSILFMLGMQWVSVTPVNASPLSLSKHSTLSRIRCTKLDRYHYSLHFIRASLIAQPSTRIIAPSSASLDTKTPHEVAINIVGTDQIKLTSPIILSGVLKDLATGAGIPNKIDHFFYLWGSSGSDTYRVAVEPIKSRSQETFQLANTRSSPPSKERICSRRLRPSSPSRFFQLHSRSRPCPRSLASLSKWMGNSLFPGKTAWHPSMLIRQVSIAWMCCSTVITTHPRKYSLDAGA